MAVRPDVLVHFGADTAGVDAAMERVNNSARSLQTAFTAIAGAGIGGFGLAQFLEINRRAEGYEAALKAVTGTQDAAAESMRFLREEANKYGVILSDIIPSYVRLSAATKRTTLEGEGARDIFDAIIQSGAKLSLTSDEVGRALRAVAQMAGNSVVQLDELRDELGGALPVAMQALASQVGGMDQLLKKVSAGAFKASEALPLLSKGLKELLNLDGSPVDTLTGNINRLGNALEALAVASSGIPETKKAIGELADTLQDPKTISAVGDLKALTLGWLSSLTELGAAAVNTVSTEYDAYNKFFSLIGKSVEEQRAAMESLRTEAVKTADAVEKIEVPPDRQSLSPIGPEKGALDFLRQKPKTVQDFLPPDRGPRPPERTVPGTGTGTRPFGNLGVGASEEELAALRERFDAEQAEEDRFYSEQAAKRQQAAAERRARLLVQVDAEGDIWAQYRAEQAAAADGDAEAQKAAQAAQVEALKRLLEAGASDAAKAYYGKLVGEVEANAPTAKMKVVMDQKSLDALPTSLQSALASGQYDVTLKAMVIPELVGGDQGIQNASDKTGANE